MERVAIFLTVLSLGALAYATYILARGQTRTAIPILLGVVIIWVALYMLTGRIRARRRQRW
ncbi:MAG: hypothetical protein GF320_17845 [Armatimonadia bacterium]|nr:hypothetical protein [Armatimonadia bacterium]